MKIIRNFLLLLLVAGIAFSCSNTKKKIEKKWIVQDFQSPEIKDLTPEQKTEIINKIMIEFSADGNYLIVGLKETKDEGKWELSKDEKSIVTKSTDGKQETMQIDELADNKLVISQTVNGVKTTMVLIPK